MIDDALTTLRRFATPEQTPWTVDEALAALEPFGDQIVPGLIEVLKTDEFHLQLLALEIIQQIGPRAEDAFPDIIAMLQGDHRLLRIAAASALCAIGPSAKDAVPLLDQMLDSDDECLRFGAASSILHIDSTESAKALSVIIGFLNNKNSPNCIFAAAFLGERGNQDAVPDLKQLLNDEDAGLRSESSLAIWKITGDSTDALIVGRKLLDDPNWLVQQIGVEHFEELGVDLESEG